MIFGKTFGGNRKTSITFMFNTHVERIMVPGVTNYMPFGIQLSVVAPMDKFPGGWTCGILAWPFSITVAHSN